MAKKKILEVVEENGIIDDEEVVLNDKVENLVFPEVSGNGRFQAVQFGEGFVVYNPSGQRCTEVTTLVLANDIVRQQNQAAHIKG